MEVFRWFVWVLGVFEFFSAYQFFTSPHTVVADNTLLPHLFASNPAALCVYVAYILTLGLQRLTYAYSEKTWGTYGSLVLTHVVEVCVFVCVCQLTGSKAIVEIVRARIVESVNVAFGLEMFSLMKLKQLHFSFSFGCGGVWPCKIT
jgi:hypothetical protein